MLSLDGETLAAAAPARLVASALTPRQGELLDGARRGVCGVALPGMSWIRSPASVYLNFGADARSTLDFLVRTLKDEHSPSILVETLLAGIFDE